VIKRNLKKCNTLNIKVVSDLSRVARPADRPLSIEGFEIFNGVWLWAMGICGGN
jgi:hypothetical protein